MENNNFKVMEIENPGEMSDLTCILANNGYKVQVTPVYETEETLKASGRRPFRHMRPQINHYAVELVGKVEKPVYKED